MELRNFTYLLLLLVSSIIPLLFSFRGELKFYRKIKFLIPGILFSGIIFILWDIKFKEMGIWKFNPDYLTGLELMSLPLEEWLLTIIAPYCSIFLYEVIKVKCKKFNNPNFFIAVSLLLLVGFGVTAYLAKAKIYTFFTLFLLTIYFGYTIFRNRFKQHLSNFYLTWITLLLPFFIFNGILTSLPIIEYNDLHNLGIRIFTVPIEDLFTFFLMLIINITIYEYVQVQKIIKFNY